MVVLVSSRRSQADSNSTDHTILCVPSHRSSQYPSDSHNAGFGFGFQNITQSVQFDSSAISTPTMTEEDLQKTLFDYIDEHQKLYIDCLAEAVAIPSVSAELPDRLPDINRMMDWTAAHITRLGGTVELRSNPAATPERELPPILMGEFRAADAATKKTVCVYGHLDVQPAAKEDGWDSDPFVLTERDGKLYGRGSTDDKGPALSWLWIVEAHQELGLELPVNIKVLYEGLEEDGSDGLFELINSEARGWLKDVDFFCISDNYWLGKHKPCLTYGLRGLAYFELTVQGCQNDLHSGVLGGSVHEAMTNLMKLMSALVDSQGTIPVPGIMDDVAPLTADEEALYESIDVDPKSFAEENKITHGKLLKDDKRGVLLRRWKYPTLSLHGIEGAFAGPGAKTVIQAAVKGKFSMRLVPDMDPDKVHVQIRKYSDLEFAKLNSPNAMKLTMLHGSKAWLSSPKHPNYQAAARAIQKVFHMEPDYTREGGSIPVTNAMEDATGMNVLLLPIGTCDDMAHSQTEKFNISNMMNCWLPKIMNSMMYSHVSPRRKHWAMLLLGMLLIPSPVMSRASSSSSFGHRQSSLGASLICPQNQHTQLSHRHVPSSLVVMAPTSASRQATLSRRIHGYIKKHNHHHHHHQRRRYPSSQSSSSSVLLASTATTRTRTKQSAPLAEEQASLLTTSSSSTTTSSSPLESALKQEPPSFSDLSLFGKVVAGVTEMTLVCVFDYLSGFAMAYAAGALFGFPKFFQDQTVGQWHGRNRRWGHSWGSISAVVGGTNVAARVVRGGKEDEWTSVLSSMAMGAFWRRTQGPKAMIQGALTYGAIIYFLSAGNSPKRRAGISEDETALLDGDQTVVDF